MLEVSAVVVLQFKIYVS